MKSLQVFVALLAAALVAAAGLAQAALTAPLLKEAKFRGGNEVVATAPGISITEADLFHYMVLTGVGDVRDVVGWKKLSEPQKVFIHAVLDLMIYTELVQPKYQTPANAEDVALEIKGEEVTAYPAYRFLWGDIFAREKMRIFPEDIVYHFKENPALYTKPETAVVRRLRVPTPSPLSIEARNAALARTQLLRARAAQSGGLAPLLIEDATLLIDPPGRTVALTRDMPGVDPQILDEAFALTVSQISRPIQTPSGFILLEVVDHTAEEPVSLEKMTPEIRADLEKLQLGQQYNYQMLKAYMESYPVDRARLFEYMSDDTDLISVGGFSMTVGEFKKVFPDIVGDPESPNVLAVAGQTFEVITGEIARRDLTKAGYIDDPLLVSCRALAKKIYRMNQYGRIRRAEVNPTAEELKEFIDSKPAELDPGNMKTVWALRISPRQSGNYTQQQLDTMQILMQNYMTIAMRDAGTKLSAARAEMDADAVLDPEVVLRSMTQPTDPRVRLRTESMGEFSKFNSQMVLGVRYDALLMDEFTQPIPLRDGSVVSYFVTEEKPASKLPRAQVEAAARQLYINQKAFEDVFATVKQWKKDNQIVYAEPLRAGASFGKPVAADTETTDTLKTERPAPAIVP